MDEEENIDYEKQAEMEAKQRKIQSNVESVKNATTTLATAYGGKVAGTATRIVANTKTGNKIANAAGNTMYNVNNSIKHPIGIIDQMQNSSDNEETKNSNELKNEEPKINYQETLPQKEDEKKENKSFFKNNDSNDKKKKFNLKRLLVIASLIGLLLFVLLFLIIIIGPGAGAILDLTENTNLNNSNKNDSSNYSVNNESDLNNLQYVSINMTDLAVPLYYSDHTTILSSLKFNVNVESQIKGIMKNVSSYVKSNPKLIPRFETAGSTVRQNNPTQNDYHSQGYAIDLFNQWSYTNGATTYYPYRGQGTNTWGEYTKFICDVCNGQENCDKNINYIIFEKYFKDNGWCWGGNWGPSYFDPMHFELRKGGCSVANKQTISC